MYDNEPTMMGQPQPTASLVVRQGAQAGMNFSITGNQVVVGREEGVDIILQDPEASRRHSRISWQGNQYVIEDMNSTNGTFVNGVQITTPQILNPGDSIGIGQTALVFQMAGGQPGGYPYQSPPPQQAQSYAPVSETSSAKSEESKTTQYMLYGCGCLLLIGICILLMIAAAVLVAPEVVEDMTGLDISSRTIQSVLNIV